MENLIYAIVKALGTRGVTFENIHDACVTRDWKEDDIFLAFKAAENLYNSIRKQEEELRNRPAPFGRK